jgi:hypothetical protein
MALYAASTIRFFGAWALLFTWYLAVHAGQMKSVLGVFLVVGRTSLLLQAAQ